MTYALAIGAPVIVVLGIFGVLSWAAKHLTAEDCDAPASDLPTSPLSCTDASPSE